MKKQKSFLPVIPFFTVLAVLTAAAYCIPLRPTVSYTEKRELTKFPEFTASGLLSGEYLSGITVWFSDTFPGREEWLSLSADVQSLYGSSDVYISAVASDQPAAEDTEPAASARETDRTYTTLPADSANTTEATTWGGVDAGAEEEIGKGSIIQIGDSAFNQMGMNQAMCERYGESLSHLAELLPQVRIISAPCPTAVGIMVEEQYLEELDCAQQDAVQNTLHESMCEDIIKVDVFSNLIKHNSEYIYFRTDHHWTALGAYYAYEALCDATGQEAAELSSFTEWDQGSFAGSLYWQTRWPKKLRKDDCVAYIPQGDITMEVLNENLYGKEMPLLQDMTQANENAKYLTFMSSDHMLCRITNESVPEGSVCLVIKDSFGNCLVPFLTQNYHTIYAIDYRKYCATGLKYFAERNGVQDIIFCPYLIATQSVQGNDLIQNLCK